MQRIGLLVLLLCPCLLWAQPEVKLIELDFGITSADIESKEELVTSPSESHLVMGALPHFLKKTDSIPAILGTQFAVAYRLEYEKEINIPVTIRWTYPEGMKDSKGRSLHKTEYQIERPVKADLSTFYVFESENELVPGKWTLTILYQRRVLYKKDFHVFRQAFSHKTNR
ncbi:MAG: DUF3859 domain-containing protein [Bacteroidetes bacterium]|nr:DUF3859 domain-containing protein [Bacteroidota bacterium]